MPDYKLEGDIDSRNVWLEHKKLSPKRSQKHHNHSPDGFSWGYEGSGPAQLALAIMLELTGKSDEYQDFKRSVIAKLPFGQSFNILFTRKEDSWQIVENEN